MTFNLKPCGIASAVAMLLALMTSSVSSQEAARERQAGKAALATGAETRALGGLVAPNARLAGLFDAGGAPIRTKGVQSIARIGAGVYCIRPTAATSINVNNIVVMVSTEYFYSGLDEIKVQWASRQHGCGAGRIGIYTLADPDRDGVYSFSNLVGFSVLVP